MAGIKLPFKKRYTQPLRPKIASSWASSVITAQTGVDLDGWTQVADNGSAILPYVRQSASGVSRQYYTVSGDQSHLHRDIAPATLSGCTLIVKIKATGTATNSCWMSGSGSATDNSFYLYRDSGNNVVCEYGGGSKGASTLLILSAAEYTIVGRFNTTTIDLWVNGAKVASTTYGSVASLTLSQFAIGSLKLSPGGSPLYACQDEVIASTAINRYISDDEVVALSQNPWQLFDGGVDLPLKLFAPPEPKTWFPIGGNVALGGMFTFGTVTYNLSMSDSLSASDFQATAMTAALAITESSAATDSQTASMTASVAVAETGTLADTQTSGMTASFAIAEAVDASDTQTASLSAALSITETGSAADAQAAVRTVPTGVSETGSAADAQAATLAAALSVSESGAATDAQTAAYNVNGAVAETSAITHTQSAAMIAALSSSDAVILADASIGNVLFQRYVNESGSLTDSQTSALLALLAMVESGAVIDAQSASLQIVESVAELASIQDNQTGTVFFEVFVSESSPLADTAVVFVIDKSGSGAGRMNLGVTFRANTSSPNRTNKGGKRII
jgi:hypothetical protein